MKSLPNRWLDAKYCGGNDWPLIKWANEDKAIRISEAPFRPYFFIHEKDLPKAGSAILRNKAEVEKGDFISVRGYKCVKIICRSPSDVHRKRFSASLGLRPQLESIGVETFEADIPFVRRVMIDEDIRQAPIKHRSALDIEVDARKGFPVPEKAEFRLLSIAIVGDDKREYFFSFEDEREMILEAYNVLNKRYSLVTAWNWKNFDGKYLINRTKKLKLKAELFPIQEMDAMLNYKKITLWGFTGQQYRLEVVAKRHLGIDHECLPGAVPILTSEGYIPISALASSFYTGLKPCVLIKTNKGFIFGSEDHLVLNSNLEWVHLKNLKKEDRLLSLDISSRIRGNTNDQIFQRHMQVLWEALQRERSCTKEKLEFYEESAKITTTPQQNSSFGRVVGSHIRENGTPLQKADSSSTLGKQSWSSGFSNRKQNSSGNLQLDELEVCLQQDSPTKKDYSPTKSRIYSVSFLPPRFKRTHGGSGSNVEICRVEDLKYVGVFPTYNLEQQINKNYILPGGIISHNSMKSKMDAERLWASFVGDKKELREYNLMDARIVVMLDELLKLSEPYIDIAQQFPIMLRDAPLMSMVLETILLREAAKSTPRLVFPNREHKTANLIGGFTLQPKPGVHKGVLSLDYKSLYPTTMATFKLSPELVMLYKSWKESGLDFDQWVERAFGRRSR